MREAPSGGKVVFADQLRGIAALLVAVDHFTGVYWIGRPTVSAFIAAPEQPGPVPWLAGAFIALPFNPGAFGVALFFLISGFVIPFSFRHHTRVSFLLARVLRIYPTYVAAMAVGLAARWLSARFWHGPFLISREIFWSNLFLVQDLVGVPTTDLVNWTLSIELKFYLLVALGYAALMRSRAWFVLAAGCVVLAINAGAVALMPGLVQRGRFVAEAVGDDAMCVGFMLLGTLFHLAMRNLITTRALLASSAVGLLLFAATWLSGPLARQFPGITLNYVGAWLVFAACYAGRRWFRPVAPLRALAAISFPFYLVHSVPGYAVMAILINRVGVAFPLALAAALGLGAIVATVLHVTVERPSIRAGRALGRLPASAAVLV